MVTLVQSLWGLTAKSFFFFPPFAPCFTQIGTALLELAKYLCSAQSLPGKNPCSRWMLLGEQLWIRRGKSHYVGSISKGHQPIKNILFLSLNFFL